MKVIGILLIVIGIVGVGMGMVMFGDIGVACIIAALTALLSGTGFLIAAKRLKQRPIVGDHFREM